MRRYVPLLWLGTLCACTSGARASRVPAATPDASRAPTGAVATERMVNVPSLVGLDLEAAAERAHAAGLELMVLRVPGLPAGLVLEQNPSAGRVVPEGAPLRVRIASGNASGSMPIAPSSLATGPGVPRAPLPDLPPSVVPEVPVVATPETAAPATPPAAGEPGDVLPIPSVLDRTEPVARRILFDAGFRVRIEPTGSGVTGRVMDQLPSPGDRVPRGTEIVLKVPGYVPSAEAALGSPDAAPEGTIPSTPPVAVAPGEPAAPATPSRAAPSEVAVAPPVDEVLAPIFASPKSLAGASPTDPAPLPTPPPPPAPETPVFQDEPLPDAPAAPPPAPPATPPTSLDVPPAPDAPPAPPVDVLGPPELQPVPQPPPAPPPSDAVPVPPSDAVPPPVPPSNAVSPPVPPSDAVPPPVPPSDAVPVPPPTPPSSPTESAGEPAGPSLPGLEIPKPKSPPSESRIPISPSVSVELTWEPIPGATGYLIELEEAVDGAWTPLQRRIVKAPKALAQIEPSSPTSADVRWRVRSVVGRRGGRPAPWIVFHLR